VKDKRIGVWFSVALVIMGLSAWVGSKLGARVAAYRYRSAQHQTMGSLTASEHAHLESVLDELNTIGMYRTILLVTTNDDKLKTGLLERIGKFEDFGRHLNTTEARPVFDSDLALVSVVAAIADEQGNNMESAARHMRSAQSLFQSLGWKDYSDATIRLFAQTELDQWRLKPQDRGNAK
jgi:hypothetical protein